MNGFIKYIFVVARFSAAHKSRIPILSALCEPNPFPPWTPLKPSGTLPTWPLKSPPHTNKYWSGETAEMLLNKILDQNSKSKNVLLISDFRMILSAPGLWKTKMMKEIQEALYVMKPLHYLLVVGHPLLIMLRELSILQLSTSVNFLPKKLKKSPENLIRIHLKKLMRVVQWLLTQRSLVKKHFIYSLEILIQWKL